MFLNAYLTPVRSSLVALVISTCSAQAVTVVTDFGGSDATGNWNGISDQVTGSVANAIDDTGAPTGIGISITSRFNGTNGSGTTDSTVYPDFATQDSFYGNADAGFGGQPIIADATVVISGLNVATAYDFTFYGSRTGVSDNRDTRYTLSGATSGFTELDVANNIDATASVASIFPDGGGEITLVVSEGSANTNGTGFFYLGTLQIDYTPVPEPGSALLLTCAFGGLAFRRRR